MTCKTLCCPVKGGAEMCINASWVCLKTFRNVCGKMLDFQLCFLDGISAINTNYSSPNLLCRTQAESVREIFLNKVGASDVAFHATHSRQERKLAEIFLFAKACDQVTFEGLFVEGRKVIMISYSS